MICNNITKIGDALSEAIKLASDNFDGNKAVYIPQLASISAEITNIAVMQPDGKIIQRGNNLEQLFTLQSAAKLVVLIGMLEEFGADEVRKWVRFEPSGSDFASIARLDQFGPIPSNPMLNAGSISLCSRIPGCVPEQLLWVDKWAQRLFGKKLNVNQSVFASEMRTGDRNRSLAYLLKSNNVLEHDVEDVLSVYFSLCSLEATTAEATYLPMLLANGGLDAKQNRIISRETVRIVTAIMATCGLYNETGAHLVNTGLPAKSSVSGLIMAIAPNRAGIVAASPRVNSKGTSIRGEIMLRHTANKLNWHFFDPHHPVTSSTENNDETTTV